MAENSVNRRSSGQMLDDIGQTGTQKKHAKSVAKSSISKNKINPTIPCVCTSKEETAHMLECEICSKWLHSNCVSIKQSFASTYPFVCLHCVKQLLCQIKELTEEIQVLQSTIDDQAKEISSTKNEISFMQASLDGKLEIATQLDNSQLSQSTADLPSATCQVNLNITLLQFIVKVPKPMTMIGSSTLFCLVSLNHLQALQDSEGPKATSRRIFQSFRILTTIQIVRA